MYNSSSATVITPPRRQHKLTASAAADAEKSIAFRFSTSAQGTAKRKAIYFRSSFTVADTALEERAADDDVRSGPRFQKLFLVSQIFSGVPCSFVHLLRTKTKKLGKKIVFFFKDPQSAF